MTFSYAVSVLAVCGTFAAVSADSTPILFAFSGGTVPQSIWETYDWGNITHLGFWSSPSDELRAKCAQHGVKLFQDCSTPKPTAWSDPDQRDDFATTCATKVTQNKLDGVFFDFEGTGLSKDEKSAYTDLAKTVSERLAPLNATIFVCVGGRPSYELRNYDYAGLAKYAEFLYVMMYDMHLWDDYTCEKTSQGNICSPAEASIRTVIAGTEEYLQIVPANKLVMGFPWYGQRYEQAAVPFNMGQIDYKDVLAVEDSGRVAKIEKDKDSDSLVMTCKSACIDGKKGGKIWFDDATTLPAKYAVAVSHKLRGIGMWSADKLPTPDSSGHDPHFAQRNAMWVAIGSAKQALGQSDGVALLGKESRSQGDGKPVVLAGKLYQTAEKYPSSSSPDRLAESTITFDSTPKQSLPTLTVRPNVTEQKIAGFGGAITESVAHVFGQLPPQLQDQVVEALWGPSGQRYSLGRLTIGSTDFATSVYSYNNHDGDLEQGNFTLHHDKKNGVHDLVRNASRAALSPPVTSAGGIQWIASPWSPPSWMKAAWLAPKGYFRNSAKPGMLQKDELFTSYALYTSKYLTAMKSEGINITRVTVQNEPDSADHMFPVAYPACNFNGTEEGQFLGQYLGPRLRADHPDVEIFIHDGQKFHDVPIADRVDAIVEAAGGTKYIDGVAFHWYGNNLANYQYLGELHAKYPTLPLLGTEATLQDPRTQLGKDWSLGMTYMIDIIGDLNNGAVGWIEWNVLLDSSGGPTCIGPTETTFCTPAVGHCDAPILADTKAKTIEFRPSYHAMAHASRFIPRGSTIVNVTQSPSEPVKTGISATAAVTPEGNLVVIAVNPDSKSSRQYQIVVETEVGPSTAQLTLPPHSLHTAVIPLPSQF